MLSDKRFIDRECAHTLLKVKFLTGYCNELERDPDCGRTADRVEHLHDFRLVRHLKDLASKPCTSLY